MRRRPKCSGGRHEFPVRWLLGASSALRSKRARPCRAIRQAPLAPGARGITRGRARKQRAAERNPRAGSRNVRPRRCRNSRRRGRASASAAAAAGQERVGRRPHPAHAAVARLAERHRAHRRHLRGHRRDLLYRPARRRITRRDGAGVSDRDPDHDHVRRRHGRRRGVRDCARARRRRYRPRLDAGGACAADRPLLRAGVHAGHADLRPRASGVARRPRQRAGAGGRLYADILRRCDHPVADEHHGGDPARHRQHEAAVADDALVRRLPDHSRRHARSGAGPDPAVRHARRRRRFADRLHHQYLGDVLVPVLGACARHSENPRAADSVGDVHRYPEGRRDRLFLAAAVGADHQHLHLHAGEFRHRDPGRLWHRRAAGIHADLDRVCRRHCFGANGRHGDRRGARGAGAPDLLDRGQRRLRLGRRGRDLDRPIPGYLGQPVH